MPSMYASCAAIQSSRHPAPHNSSSLHPCELLLLKVGLTCQCWNLHLAATRWYVKMQDVHDRQPQSA